MSWPKGSDYNAAIQNPPASFSDPELRQGQAAGDLFGLPTPHSGNFADVYQVTCPGGQSWAVKCFTREVPGLRDRYHAISEHLARAERAFTVDFRYLEEGIRIQGRWYPVLKMRWVEGLTLNSFLAEVADNPTVLDRLSRMWVRLAGELREAAMAHGDLQHGNVLLIPGSKDNALALRLVDYDGMWVPALAGQPSGELGHPNYQHPRRLDQGGYGAGVDSFSHLVVYTALRCLVLGGKPLWQGYDNGENLLFRQADFARPHESRLLKELWGLDHAEVQTLVGHLVLASQGPLDGVPFLPDLVGPGGLAPLPREQRERVSDYLSGPPAGADVPGPPGRPTPQPPAGGERPRRKSRLVAARATRFVLPELPSPLVPDPSAEALSLAADTATAPALPTAVLTPLEVLPVNPVAEVVPATAPASKEVKRPPTPAGRATPPPPSKPSPTAPPGRLRFDFTPLLRLWPVGLGVLIGAPFLVLVVWLLWPSTSRTPAGVRRPRLTALSPVTVRGGGAADLLVRVDRGGSTGPLEVRLGDLPPGVSHGPVPVIGPGQAEVVVRVEASAEAEAATREISVSLWEDRAKVHERGVPLTVLPYPRPRMKRVPPLALRPGEPKTLVVEVDRNGNAEPLRLEVEGLPVGVRTRKASGPVPEGALGVGLEAGPDAAGVASVRLSLWAGTRRVDEQDVRVSVDRGASPGGRLKAEGPVRLKPGEPENVLVELNWGPGGAPDKVVLRVEGLPAGVVAEPAEVPAGRDFGWVEVRALAGTEPKSAKARVVALVGGRKVDEGPLEVTVERAPPGGAKAPPPRDVTFRTADDVEVRGTFYPSARGKDCPACVLMLHEPGRDRREEGWVRLAKALRDEGYAVLTFDFRGHGESTRAGPNFRRFAPNKIFGPDPGKDSVTLRARSFAPSYYPQLVQDVVAARLFLDLLHDAGEVNASNLVVVGAGEGAALGAVWLAGEFHRHRLITPGEPLQLRAAPEGARVAACVWLGFPRTLGNESSAAPLECLTRVARERRVPMAFLYGEEDAGSKPRLRRLAESLAGPKGVRRPLLLGVPGAARAGQGLLEREEARALVLGSAPRMLKGRRHREHVSEHVESGAYYWRFPDADPVPAKCSGLKVPETFPLERVGLR
jgi:hypothetical protein